jgi:hypothetical protein
MNPINRQPSPAQRVQRAMNNPNEPTPCKKCGSIYFMEMTAQIYTSGSSGFRSVSTMPMKVYVCPCGELQIPPGHNTGIQAGGERDLFAQSIAAALAHRTENGLDAVAKNTASLAELQELQTQVAELQEQIRLVAETRGLVEPRLGPVEPGEGNLPTVAVVEDDISQDEIDREVESVPTEVPLIASGIRGRSQAGGVEAAGDVKFVEPPVRPIAKGGARANMRRQGKP